MPNSRALALLFLAGSLACAQTVSRPAGTDSLKRVHAALFGTFVPVDDLTVETPIRRQMLAVRDELWAGAGQSAALQSLLQPFAHLQKFHAQCGIAEYKHSRDSIADLTPKERQRAIALLSVCKMNEPRRLAMSVREFYVEKAYSVLQEQIAGVHLNLNAPPEWIAQHRPDRAPSRLRYDDQRHEIALQGGEIDYLIVGSGPAGSVLAHELWRSGKRVLLLERGSLLVPGSMQTRILGALLDARTSADGGVVIHNGMTVGGGSQVNVDLCFAPTRASVQAHIESWRSEGRIGSDDFTPANLSSAYEWVKHAIGTRRLDESEINQNNRVLWDGAKRRGLHPKLYDLNTYAPGQSPYPVTDKRSAESELLLAPISDTENPLSILPDADVRRVLFDGGTDRKAIGVEVRIRPTFNEPGAIPDPNGLHLEPGTLVTIRARHVILSAGALGSPAILLRSGINNEQIGRGVVLHPSMPVIGRFDREIDVLEGTQASVYVDDHLLDRGYALESMSAAPEYAALMSPGDAMHTYRMVQSFRNLAGFGVMLIDSVDSSNRLVLDDTGEPRIEYRLSDADKRRFREGLAAAVRVMFAAGAKEVYLPTIEPIEGHRQLGDGIVLTHAAEAAAVQQRLEFVPNETILTSAHMQATDKMGTNPADSVVAPDFHVWRTRNLYVVDGSVFPTSVGANPMQTIYTFAKIAADRLDGREQAAAR